MDFQVLQLRPDMEEELLGEWWMVLLEPYHQEQGARQASKRAHMTMGLAKGLT